MSDVVICSEQESWAELRINREDKRNAVNLESRRALLEAFAALRGKAKAVVVTGTGVAFCAGMDLKELEQDRAQGIEGAAQEWIEVNLAIRAHPAIFIAAVNGLALGGGATLINVCDLAVASTKASIGCPDGLCHLSGHGRARNPALGPHTQAGGRADPDDRPHRRPDRAPMGHGERMRRTRAAAAAYHALAQQISRFDAAALEESKRALDRIPAFINNWREAMDHGQMVNQMIRGKTSAQAEGGARFATGIKNIDQAR
jgi:hypothetical protein